MHGSAHALMSQRFGVRGRATLYSEVVALYKFHRALAPFPFPPLILRGSHKTRKIWQKKKNNQNYFSLFLNVIEIFCYMLIEICLVCFLKVEFVVEAENYCLYQKLTITKKSYIISNTSRQYFSDVGKK